MSTANYQNVNYVPIRQCHLTSSTLITSESGLGLCVCVCVSVCMYACTYQHSCVYVCVSVCMYACTYQHSSAHVVPGSRPQHHLLDDWVGIRLALQGRRLVLVHRPLTRDRLHARRVCRIKPWFYSLLVYFVLIQ